ncbi:MAG TPA: hypothetical protein PLS66_04820 [Tepiditoga sp.]|nr:cytoplasmic protein [Thermotogota bacterium]HOO74594.1 hypothetical protein [Tepiditoga sp.]
MKKIIFFAFRGEPMCFGHVMLNALDMYEKGYDVKIVLEGEAVKIPKLFEKKDNKLYLKILEKKIFEGVCKACSQQMGVLDFNEKSGIPLLGDMNGHPSMEKYINEGYEIIIL